MLCIITDRINNERGKDMSKTIVHNGEIYQIGKLYASSEGYAGFLTGLNGHQFVLSTVVGDKLCLKLRNIDPEKLGTIEEVPVTLQAKRWYLVNRSGWEETLYWDGNVFTDQVDRSGNPCGSYIYQNQVTVLAEMARV